MQVAHVMFRASMENPGPATLIMLAIAKHTGINAYPLLHTPCQCLGERMLTGAGTDIERRLKCYRFANKIIKLPHLRRQRGMPFDSGLFGLDCASDINAMHPDLLHLHWVADGRVSLRSLNAIEAPVVWTMHDVWPLTGGCHCNMGCTEWEKGCLICPQMGPGLGGFSATAQIWKKRKRWYKAIPSFYPVAPSRWLGAMASKSPLLEGRSVAVIPNCVDGNIFCPSDKMPLRRELGIPDAAKVLVFGATEVDSPYKGAELLVETLHRLHQISHEQYHLLVFGNSAKMNLEVAYPITHLGFLDSQKAVAKALQAADVFIGPSRQDNFPTVYLEAIACGLPCAGFAIGGIPEIARHRENGYIATPFDCHELAHGIVWLTESPERYIALSRRARVIHEAEYIPSVIGHAYADLYQEILWSTRRRSQ